MKTWILNKYNRWLLGRLVAYTGLDLTPEPGVWGAVSKDEEDGILAKIYENKDFISLLKIYAEIATKSLLSLPLSSPQAESERGRFLALNGIILKAKRAFKNEQGKPKPKTD